MRARGGRAASPLRLLGPDAAGLGPRDWYADRLVAARPWTRVLCLRRQRLPRDSRRHGGAVQLLQLLGTWQRYEQYMRLHVLPTLGSTSLVKPSGQPLQALYANRLEVG